MLFAEFYSENQSMQLYDAKLFLESVIPKLNSSIQNQDIVMDIGCGPGKTSSKILLSAFPRVKKMVGVDVSADMIEFARKNNAHKKIEYHVADIEDRYTILKWSQQISTVTSILCFHWLEKQKEAFENIFYILKPGGEAALVFVLSSGIWDAYQLITKNQKYKEYLKNKRSYIPESHFKKYGAAFYRYMLQGIGFDVIVCEEEKRSFTFPNDDACRAALYSLCGLTNYIPEKLRPEFEEDIFENFLLCNGYRDDGKHTLYYKILTLVIKKPYA
nr:juvenile hormone acid methyltransferase-5 [Pardosa pseudoannulata]